MASSSTSPSESLGEKRKNLINIVHSHFKDPSGQAVLKHRSGALHLLAAACLIARGYEAISRAQKQWDRDPTGMRRLDETVPSQVAFTTFKKGIELITQELGVFHTVVILMTSHKADTKQWDVCMSDYVKDISQWPDVENSKSANDVLRMYRSTARFDAFVSEFEEKLMVPALSIDEIVSSYSEQPSLDKRKDASG